MFYLEEEKPKHMSEVNTLGSIFWGFVWSGGGKVNSR